MKNFLQRVKEPSTWTAIGAIGALFGVPQLALLGVPETATLFASLAALLAGVFLPERARDA